MKPKRYPYSGKIKSTTSNIYNEWLKMYERFLKENEEQNALHEERINVLLRNRKSILKRMKGLSND